MDLTKISKRIENMDNRDFVEVIVVEKIVDDSCPNGCQRSNGSPTGI